MKKTSARDFPEIYEDLGISTDNMGCIMLDTEPLSADLLPPDEWGYKDDSLRFVNKFEAAKEPHATLLYGLLESGKDWQEHVDAVLADWQAPEKITLDSLEFFPNPGKPYLPLVLRLASTSHASLWQANQRLSLLPHINTFPGYKSHVTVGYVKKEYIEQVSEFYDELGFPFDLAVKGLNYGS